MPLKRPSADDVKKPLKSRRSGDPNKAKVSSIVTALRSTDTLPDSVIEMLTTMAEHCLLTGKNDRHQYQNSVIDMLSDSLHGIEISLSQAVKEADAIVTGADALKRQRNDALGCAKASVVTLEADLVNKKATLEADKQAMVAAVASLKQAETAQTQGDLDLTQATGKKENMESAVNNALNPLKEAGSDRKMLKDLERIGKVFDMDESLMEALQRSLKKSPQSRSHFDGVAVQEFEGACQKIVADLDAMLKNAEPGRVERDANVQVARATQETMCTQHEASATAVLEAEVALRQSKIDVKTAEKGVSNFFSEIQAAANDLDDKKSALAHFQKGPLGDFAYLKDPPVVVIEEPSLDLGVSFVDPVAEPAALSTVTEKAE